MRARTYLPLSRPPRRCRDARHVSIEFISVESTLDAARTLLIAATSSRPSRPGHRDAPDWQRLTLRLPVTYACIICYGFHTSHNSTDISTPPPPPPSLPPDSPPLRPSTPSNLALQPPTVVGLAALNPPRIHSSEEVASELIKSRLSSLIRAKAR